MDKKNSEYLLEITDATFETMSEFNMNGDPVATCK